MKKQKKKKIKIEFGLKSSIKQVLKDIKALDDEKIEMIQDMIEKAERKIFFFFRRRRQLMRSKFRNEAKEFKNEIESASHLR